jgi:5'-phosphate synthase pdxT subunit
MTTMPPAPPAAGNQKKEVLLIGVLALTGSFEEHEEILRDLGARTRQVKTVGDLEGLDGVVFPGGESTAMGIVDREGKGNLFTTMRQRIDAGLPVYGTCAGLILLANKAVGLRNGGQPLVGGLDVTVCRNYFGSQVSSFVVPLTTENGGSCEVRSSMPFFSS